MTSKKDLKTLPKEEVVTGARVDTSIKEILPIFNPDTGLTYQEWRNLFERTVKLQNISENDALSMIPSIFKGKALEIYASMCQDVFTLDELHQAMNTFFPVSTSGLRRQFLTEKKLPSQPLMDYYFNKLKLAKILNISSEQTLEALSSNVNAKLRPFLIAANPANLDMWIKIASSLEEGFRHEETSSPFNGPRYRRDFQNVDSGNATPSQDSLPSDDRPGREVGDRQETRRKQFYQDFRGNVRKKRIWKDAWVSNLTSKLPPIVLRFYSLPLKKKKIQITPQSPWRNYCRFRENNKKVALEWDSTYMYMESVSIDMITASSPTTSEVSFASSSHHRTVKLPKIELKKFTGEIKDWLGWWAQFNKIHVDPTLEDSDKFQYLVQSMSPGTRASKLVNSYPLTAENYPKVIETLTERFGRPELLQQVYVRDLIRLMIDCSSKQQLKVTSFYDELVTHLRALESLKIEARQMSVFIFPMIEACLSEELMKAWQRSPLHDVKIDDNDSTQTRVDLIMEFLQKEAAAEQDRALAGSKFGLRSLKQDRNVGRQSHPAKIPTASGLFAGRAQNCIFCNKDHKNTECLAARRMSIKERRERIKNAKCCFSCLQPGHISSNCRRRITECIRCKKKHLDILCPLNAPGRESADEDKEQVEDCDASPTVENGVSFSGLSASSLILLQTLKIKVEGATSAKVVRALLDTGSQRSYILSKTAQDLGLSPIGQESLKHVVFGGHTSESVHQEYRVNLGHASGNFKMVAKLLDQQKICGSLPRLSRGPWLKELKARKIWVPDIGKDDMEIEILLGCDVLGSIFMMKSCVLSNGLTASQTRFGWTLMGECQPGSDVSLAHHVTTMTISESSVTNLWNLDGGCYEEIIEQTTKKLISLNLYEDYDDIFRGWLDDGIIEKVPAEQHDAEAFYLPHRPVVKLSSGTTPIRPVFDASSKVYRSPSLNDCLEKGPNLIEMIPNLMLRFRNGKFGVVADIKKAFLQIEVNERDRDYLRFLWYSQNGEKTEVFRHRRVVFGVNCSPFILGAVIEYHLSNVRPEHKPLAQRLQKSFYVDNLVTSVNSFEELQDLKLTATSIMDNARLELSRWEHSLDVASDTYPFEGAEISKVLGVCWDKREDCLSCEIPVAIPPKITKRSILSCLAQIYDPIGFLSPILIKPKILLQKAWTLKLAWDDELDRHYKDELSLWFDDLQLHKGMAIPRNFNPLMVPQKDWQIHTFVDASSEAYAAVVFLRTRVGDKVEVHMMAAKSRVAPLKRPTIPRLELLACVVGTRLNKMIFEALELKDIKNVFWSDATTALAWIKRDDQWGTFVGNRVKEICRLSDPGNWRYVPSEYKDLNEEEICAERKKITVVTTVKSTDHWYMKYFSSFIKNVRMMAWIRRFINNLRSSTKVKGELSVKEIDEAELALLKLVQAECFPSHSIPGLKNCHAGVQFLMNKLREKYWIVKARQTIKKIVRRCVTCRRFSAKPVVVEDAPLPATRVHNAKVFEVVGIDLAGPLYLKDQTKTWVVLFTCAVYRCVHLELVISLSTEDFLMALERFIKRRGRPSTIFSDNGTNFVGANNFFKKVDWERVSNDGKVKRIEWKFIPPTAAWWGGWWERLIRSLKDILKRMLGTSTLTYQQLMTLLCHAEAVMNGRPMTYVSDDPNDLVTISPSMFLQEQTDVEFPECQNMGSNPTTQKLRYLSKLREELKSRFRKEYLSLLVQRNRRIYNPKLQAGDVVLVGMDNKKRTFWPLAVIEEILFGRDGVNRLVKVKTAVGTFLRPIQKIYPLEISSTAASSRLLNDKEKTAKIQTRSGRTICKPNRLDDYLCFSVCLDKNRKGMFKIAYRPKDNNLHGYTTVFIEVDNEVSWAIVLVKVYGEKCMDIKNVRKWCREFNEGRINVHDEQRSGRPSLPESTVARIDEMVRANRRITLEEIEDGLNEDSSHFSVHKIVSETLGYRKVSARWVDKWLKEEAGEWYNTGITKLVDRMKKVIEHQGDYVEK
ncbi:hypothetical protein LAZ67_2000392 [Cordylochernes scorpioides]|uniref:Pro-Pol polyprotein n=1 Tax=Cordylochernes scorpioides TaxID=51811 RepID=A0ABY6K0G7_9ARAC|nr:hypothetical protein LAZ67_2000392 [Cordylochernes scorpioides]